jgi:ABC-2 type transport system ATP-binding protein
VRAHSWPPLSARLRERVQIGRRPHRSGLSVASVFEIVEELARPSGCRTTQGRLQLAGPIDDLLAAHRLLTVPRATPDAELRGTAIHRADSDRHSTVLVAADPARMAEAQHPQWQAEPVSFEQLVLAYLQRPPEAAATDGPTRAGPRPGPARKAAAQ